VKLSEDDAERIFGEALTNEEVIAAFHEMGAKLVCLTLGGKGSIVSSNYGKDCVEIAGRPIEVKDATGLWLAVDDDGTGLGIINECSEANNGVLFKGPFCE
jgi:hypothetical protein